MVLGKQRTRMHIRETGISGCYIIEPAVFEDKRGYFFESFNKKMLESKLGYVLDFVQDNQSQSSYGVIRGLHMQLEEMAQSKLVRAIQGSILDVIVDLRPGSETFGKYFSITLSEENKKQLFIPKGFAHGFAVLSEKATIHYKADNYYAPTHESGIIFNDPDLNIDWQLNDNEIITSDKDLSLPTFMNFKKNN